jgi:hypothetical protein
MLLKMVKVMNRLKLNSVGWKEFNMIDIFEIVDGYYNKKPPAEKNGKIPFLSATAYNNGVSEFYSKDTILTWDKVGNKTNNNIDERLFSGNCIAITNNGSVGHAFYQEDLFTCSHDITPVYLKNYELNKYIAFFLIVMLEKTGKSYEYGKKWRPKRMRRSKILLPINDNNEPNWRFMEDYARQELKSQTEKVIDYYEQKLIDEASILLDLKEVEWNLFQIDEIFDVKRVEGKPINNYENGNIPYVTTSSENNGITNFVNAIESDISKRSAISVDPVGGTTFYHDYDFIGRGFSGSSINLLYNDNLNSLNSKFVCSAIEKVSKVKASYGIHFNGNRLRSAKVLLPLDENGNPNWKYMTDFIKKLEHETASKALEYIYIYKLAIYKELEYSLESREWEVFNLDQVFNLIQRGRRLTRRDQIEGNVPYISSTGLNNGLDNYIGNTDKVRVFDDCLTIANSGSVGATFYQRYEFIGSDHITALKMDKATENIYLFLATKLKSLENKYSFNREINDRRIRREKIMLPAKEGKPDYDFMNKYIAIEKIKSIYKTLNYYKEYSKVKIKY